MKKYCYTSTNPKNGQQNKSYECISNDQLNDRLERAFKVYKKMLDIDNPIEGVRERLERLEKVKGLLGERKQKIAQTITDEMGKPLKESAGEVEKAIKMIEYYQNNAVEFMQDENLPSKFLESYVVNQPLGPTLCNSLGFISYYFRYLTLELPDLAQLQDKLARSLGRKPYPH
jgi:succinate-semialdehyde dehydrogenase/glutarate-semialdehyde dehydrogenase